MTEATIFAAALDVADPADRAAYLDRACGHDPALRRRIEDLLRFHGQTGNPLDAPPDREAGGAAEPADAQAQAIGRYRLLDVLGEGGMGTVYRAEQTEPVRRHVALKVIRAGKASRGIVARFEAERQTLALMDHPHIARVLDGGSAPDGRPYFVMELVSGSPITRYCDDRRLPVRDRLELFAAVCQAVHHAHQKAVIHRDLKPSNVLVAEVDGRAVPKVIDFGVSKAVGPGPAGGPAETGAGVVIGTPAYMAPEQAASADVDTRADVYALGVLLYELLTGTTPLERDRLENASALEILRLVRELDPPRPSTRLSHADTPPATAANRHTDTDRLTKTVRGDLDWVVMKCLDKDRDRRYESAAAVAADVGRFLRDEPVAVGPPSAAYRLRKFVRRNRVATAATAAVTVALVAGVVGTSVGLLKARREADLKERARADEAEQRAIAEVSEGKALAAAAAETRARRAEEEKAKSERAIKDYVVYDLLALTSVEGQDRFGGDRLDRTATLLDLLNRAAGKLKARTDLSPLVEAELSWIVGVNYRGAGEADKGLPFLERAVELRRRVLGPEHADTLITANSLAAGYEAAGQLDKARTLHEETFRLRTATLGPGHQDTLASKSNLAWCELDGERFDQALQWLEEVLRLRQETLGADHQDTLASMNSLAEGHLAAGRLDKALALHEETFRLRKAKLGHDHPDALASMNNLGIAYVAAKRLDLAVPLIEEALRLRKAKLGHDHPDTLASMNSLAEVYRSANRIDKAVPLSEDTLRLRTARLGPNHPHTLVSLNDLAEGYRRAGRPDKALPLSAEAFRLRTAKLGPDHPDTLASMGHLAACHWSLGQLDKSVPLFEALLPRQERRLGRGNPSTQRTLANLGVNYTDAGRAAEAIPLLEEAYRSADRWPILRWVADPLLRAYAAAGKTAAAAKLIGVLVADARTSLPKDSLPLAAQLDQYGATLLHLKAFAEAAPLLRECLAIREEHEPDVWTTFNTRSMLGGVLLGQQKYADAEPLLVQGYDGLKARERTVPPPAHARVPEALDRLIALYAATDRREQAQAYRDLRAKYPPEPAPNPRRAD